MYYVFAGGGTGGHLYPALAIVEALREQEPAAQVSFYCTSKLIDRDILAHAGIRAVPLSVQPFPNRPWRWPAFLLRWRESVKWCMRDFLHRRPAAVIGTGGYASGPPVHIALRLGIPTFLLCPDAVPGRANLHFARRGVRVIFAQYEVTRRYFPAGAPVVVSGCPVRAAFTRADANGELLRSVGLDPGRRTLLVTGASQGARTINEALAGLAPEIAAADWQVLHLSGHADQALVTEAYRRAELPAAVLPFTPEMPSAMRASDLIISRAGASSLAEISALGKPSILLPYPFHRDRHQWHNAAPLAEAGAAVILDDQKDGRANAAALRPVLVPLLCDDARREAMAAAARAHGRPGAAQVIASALRETSAGKPPD